MSSVCVATRKSVVWLVAAGWKQCLWVWDVDPGLVDLGRLLEKKTLGQKRLGTPVVQHHKNKQTAT